MRYPVTTKTKELVEAIDRVRRRVRSRLDRISAEAREEWAQLLLKVPTEEDLLRGVIDLSPEALSEMIAKASRFEQILESTRRPAQRSPQRDQRADAATLPDEALN
jgi:hypothetical protein